MPINQSTTLLDFDFFSDCVIEWLIDWSIDLIDLIDRLVEWLVDWLIGSVISFLNGHFHLWFNLGHLNFSALSDFDCDFWLNDLYHDWLIDWLICSID